MALCDIGIQLEEYVILSQADVGAFAIAISNVADSGHRFILENQRDTAIEAAKQNIANSIIHKRKCEICGTLQISRPTR